jgi:hypothetical protein
MLVAEVLAHGVEVLQQVLHLEEHIKWRTALMAVETVRIQTELSSRIKTPLQTQAEVAEDKRDTVVIRVQAARVL